MLGLLLTGTAHSALPRSRRDIPSNVCHRGLLYPRLACSVLPLGTNQLVLDLIWTLSDYQVICVQTQEEVSLQTILRAVRGILGCSQESKFKNNSLNRLSSRNAVRLATIDSGSPASSALNCPRKRGNSRPSIRVHETQDTPLHVTKEVIASGIQLPNLPTSSGSLQPGQLWVDTAADHTLKVTPD